MDPDRVLDRLLETGVLVDADGDSLALSERFRDARSERIGELSTVDDDEVAAALREATGGRIDPADDRQERIRTLATLDALATHGEFDAETRLTLLPVLDEFEADPPREAGVPHAFTPVTGSQLVTLLESSRRAIVYVWRDDCDPCDVMREEFDDMFPEPPEDIALLAVYGPDAMDAMDRYDVVGAPTTLFVSEGSIDIRLQGAQYRELLETELEHLRDQ